MGLGFEANSQHSQVNGSTKKKVNPEPALKRPRIETPSPLPTFKVRHHPTSSWKALEEVSFIIILDNLRSTH